MPVLQSLSEVAGLSPKHVALSAYVLFICSEASSTLSFSDTDNHSALITCKGFNHNSRTERSLVSFTKITVILKVYPSLIGKGFFRAPEGLLLPDQTQMNILYNLLPSTFIRTNVHASL